MAQRERARARGATHRSLLAVIGLVLGLASLPLMLLLPEIGAPAMLLALRLLAVEFDWAAHAYAWLLWRWEQLRGWFRTRSPTLRALISVVLLALAALLVWWLVEELA
ncbi:MAG: hypothetical protein AVDCRST_MAG65-294 [uncultured Solirubrobacteraceae bacterium]|uniref:Transmembrane protein (PGPGW) n=1 Tax=uncultured Solirubrobacteraceae bacterium TaxID=1162706 RepID=A0A6J4RAR0_9ACTN|nr:MAG: hypothetical protein AVDCRST_MAG65-294 [uncultured Solirubrobacteraceae bacterium]